MNASANRFEPASLADSVPYRALSHPLDNVIWNALTSRQCGLAEGDDLARRYDPAFARFGALADMSSAALTALSRLVARGERVALLLCEDIEPGPHFVLVERKDLMQMVGPAHGNVADPERFAVLSDADWPQIHDLARRTEPGPFCERTPELGRFIGFKVDGRLVAMAGERMHLTSHTEISAVCTDPAWRGRGLARDLILLASRAIVARDETPFLHVLPGNTSAVALYRRLGFLPRVTSRLALLQRV